MAETLLKQHALDSKGWVFRFDNATSRLGATHFHKKKITVSRHTASVATVEQMRQILLHEIAHALLPPGEGHGKKWKELSAQLGYTGKRTLPNPYIHPKKTRKASTRKANTAKASPEASGVRTGDRLKLPNGEVVVVLKAARTRFHARSETTGKMWGIPFAIASNFKL